MSFKGPCNGLGTESTEQSLKESVIRSHASLTILQQHLEKNEWLTLQRPAIGDIATFVYFALAPIRDVFLEHYPAVKEWLKRIRMLPGFIPIEGLDDLMYWRR